MSKQTKKTAVKHESNSSAYTLTVTHEIHFCLTHLYLHTLHAIIRESIMYDYPLGAYMPPNGQGQYCNRKAGNSMQNQQSPAAFSISKNILIIEDDIHINSMLRETLTQCGYACTGAYSGTEALMLINQTPFDLIILDLMLPGMPGTEVLKAIRRKHAAPVIVLSALDELDTKVDLLTLGANDYMTKPFEIEELKARILVQLRTVHSTLNQPVKLIHRGLCLDEEKKALTAEGQPVSLTAQEFKIMELFLRNPQRVFSKNEIYEYAWKEYYIGEDKTIHVHISNIRQKLKQVSEQEYIETIWGLGFRLV